MRSSTPREPHSGLFSGGHWCHNLRAIRSRVLDLVLPGTESMSSGIYFARLDAGQASVRGRVPVLR